MPILTQAEYFIGDLCVRYLASADRPDAWGLAILPSSRVGDTVAPREWLDSAAVRDLPAAWNQIRAWEIDPLVHVHVRGDTLPGGFAQGRTLRNSATTAGLKVQSHTRETASLGNRDLVVLRTTLVAECGLLLMHEIVADAATGTLTIQLTAENPTAHAITLDHLGAFSLGGITPFARDDAPERLHVHRFRSGWSAEGRHESQSVEALNLERSWTGHGVRSERFGQVGSLPVNGWFPLVGVEDRVADVTWLAQLATPGTWHLEIYRRADQLALAGGGADRWHGEGAITLAPGARTSAPTAFLTAVSGGIDEACDRLIAAANARTTAVPASERDLPIIFNEWCTSWGHPTHEKMVQLADDLAITGIGVKYLVIDDGWAERPGNQFQQNGDWRVNRAAFPEGLRATTDAIRIRGLVPGIWFEFEVVNPGSAAWDETSHQLHRDGAPLQVGNRRFWDFRDPWVHDFLAERVIARLRDDGFGYLKVDYNDSTGPGVDGPASPGENLCAHLAGVQRFFARLRQELPDLVIENCSSGGHRLEASMMALTAMSSFSDAHETTDIPLIAANLNRLVPARQKQIWAVLRRGDSPARLGYSLAATFLGRMCLSGDWAELPEASRAFVRTATQLYRAVAPVIRDGVFRTQRVAGESYQHPTGHQLVTIHDDARRQLVIVWHHFARGPATLEIELPACAGASAWELAGQLKASPAPAALAGNRLHWTSNADFTGGVWWLRVGGAR